MAWVRRLGTNEGNWPEDRSSSLDAGSVPDTSGTLNYFLIMIVVCELILER